MVEVFVKKKCGCELLGCEFPRALDVVLACWPRLPMYIGPTMAMGVLVVPLGWLVLQLAFWGIF